MHLKAKEYDVDDVLTEVGQFGRYQKKLFIYFNTQHILLALVALSIVFVGAEPPWKCSTAKDIVIRSIGFNAVENTNSGSVDKDRCALYEKRSCSVEVDQPHTTIVAEVRSQEMMYLTSAPSVGSMVGSCKSVFMSVHSV